MLTECSALQARMTFKPETNELWIGSPTTTQKREAILCTGCSCRSCLTRQPPGLCSAA